MPAFADFNKETKDLLTKNYAEKGAWKVESKGSKGPLPGDLGKGGFDHFVFNPSAATGKGLSMDLEWAHGNCPMKTKTNITEAGVIKEKVTFDQKPHKLETQGTYNPTKDSKFSFDDVNYEIKIPHIAANLKFDNAKGNVETNNSLAIGNGLSFGSGVTYNLNQPDVANQWKFGAYYAANGLVANWTTQALKKWTFGANYPINVSGTKINAAVQVEQDMKWTVGGEGPCFNCPGAMLRAKVNQDLTVDCAWIRKIAGGWKAAISAQFKKDGAFSWGTTFTFE